MASAQSNRSYRSRLRVTLDGQIQSFETDYTNAIIFVTLCFCRKKKGARQSPLFWPRNPQKPHVLVIHLQPKV
jgi:hypothetical protein